MWSRQSLVRSQAFYRIVSKHLPGSLPPSGHTAEAPTARSSMTTLMQGGGQGASSHEDGKDALKFPTSAAGTSVEMFETRTPLLVECKELIADSGGAGQYRGGLGQRVRLRKLSDDSAIVVVAANPPGIHVDAPGLFKGRGGRRAGVWLSDTRTGSRTALTSGYAELRTPFEVLTLEVAGGGGYGDPRERSLAAVERDFSEGRVTDVGLADYGRQPGPDGSSVRRSRRTERDGRARRPRSQGRSVARFDTPVGLIDIMDG